MAHLRPFPGLCFDTARVALDAVLATPPGSLAPEGPARRPYPSATQALRVTMSDLRPRPGTNRFADAAAALASWSSHGIVRREPEPALYLYRMTSPDGGRTIGVIGALALGDEVLPHEETIPEIVADHFALLRATRTDLSPVWCLSPARGLTDLLIGGGMCTGPAMEDAYDGGGVRHELWRITDRPSVDAICAVVGSGPLVVADGHHRYRAAQRFHADQAMLFPASASSGAVMAFVVELCPEMLALGAVHRAVSGLPRHFDLVAAAARSFDLVPEAETVQGSEHGPTAHLTLLTPDGTWRLHPRAGPSRGEVVPDAELVSHLLSTLPPHDLQYCYDWTDIASASRPRGTADRGADGVFILRAVSIDQVISRARAGRLLPPKSTYFMPKPGMGMMFRPVD